MRDLVWIDLANSPHVLFFAPVIEELKKRDVRTFVTARDFAQTVDMCRLLGIDCIVSGAHGGSALCGKGKSLLVRARELVRILGPARPALALSHNSYAQIVAARTLGARVATAMDYEFQVANHLAFRLAHLVALPEALPAHVVRRQGARPGKVWRYAGLKEHIALAGFRPTVDYRDSVGLPLDKTVVVVRPPADMALYHRFENPLFLRLLDRLRTLAVHVMLLPRTSAQHDSLVAQGYQDMVWCGPVLDGRELIAAVDAVFSAGGTMNREAAVLGTPAYSVYAGRPAAVDAWLAQHGGLTFLPDEASVEQMRVESKPAQSVEPVSDRLLVEYVDRVLELL